MRRAGGDVLTRESDRVTFDVNRRSWWKDFFSV